MIMHVLVPMLRRKTRSLISNQISFTLVMNTGSVTLKISNLLAQQSLKMER
jgi:hypothetical protein